MFSKKKVSLADLIVLAVLQLSKKRLLMLVLKLAYLWFQVELTPRKSKLTLTLSRYLSQPQTRLETTTTQKQAIAHQPIC